MTVLSSLLRGAYWYAEALERELHQKGLSLTRGQHFVLANIVGGEHQATRIAKNLGVSRQAVSQTITELVELGYVKTRDDPSDKRSRIVDFSPSFEDQKKCVEIFRRLDRELSARIGKKHFAWLRQALEADWGSAPALSPPSQRRDRAQPKRVTARAGNGQVPRRLSAGR